MRMVVDSQVERAVALSRHSPLHLPQMTDRRQELHEVVYTHVLTMHSVWYRNVKLHYWNMCRVRPSRSAQHPQ